MTRTGDISLLLIIVVSYGVGVVEKVQCGVVVVEKVQSKKVYKPTSRFLMPYRDKDICLDSRDDNDVQCDLQSDDVDEIQGYHQKYRTIDGTCNNIMHPLWGASNMPLKRLLSPAYEYGRNTPIGWSDPPKLYHGFAKPNPREVTLRVLQLPRSRDKFSAVYTDFVTVWGQFTAHDIDLTPRPDVSAACSTKCKKKVPFCFPIHPAVNDPRLSKTDCISQTRSYPVCDNSSNAVRQQQDNITAFIDASMVYGSTRDGVEELRDFSDDRGFLKAGDTTAAAAVGASGHMTNKYLMPCVKKSRRLDCVLSQTDSSGVGRFLEGDVRVNEHITVKALETIWMREHNRIAEILKGFNPHWNGNCTFQETRKIIGALMQHISYAHWLPYVVGKVGMGWLSKYKGYDTAIDPSIANVFTAAALRYGHIHVNLTDLGGPDVAPDFDSLDIQRGRDHGLTGYNKWRKFCSDFVVSKKQTIYGSIVLDNFDDLASEIGDGDVRARLKSLYGHPDNVDLHVAGLIEDPLEGGLIGPTYTCLIIEQLGRIRDGDRFWYENPGVFSFGQLREIKRQTLARVLCDSGDDITRVQRDVFIQATDPDIPCDNIPSMDLTEWIDDP